MTKGLQTFSGRRASQSAWELKEFIAFLKSRDVRSFGEIGARNGDTGHEVMLALPSASKYVGVDLPGGLWGKPTTRKDLVRAVEDLCRRGYEASAIFGNSTHAHVIAQFACRGPYDAILIDGSHTYEGVSSDWRAYGSMGKLIAFHDIAGEGERERRRKLPVEVPRLWREIVAGEVDGGYTTLEFVSKETRMGIGVVTR